MRSKKPPQSRRSKMSLRESLVLTLVWMWTGLPLSKLLSGSPFQHESGLRYHLRMFIDNYLTPFAEETIQLPSLLQWDMQRGNLELPEDQLRFNIDGTPFEIWQPTDPKIAMGSFNHKHQMPAVSCWIMTSMNGRIVYISPINTGNTHDATAFNDSGIVRDLLGTLRQCIPLHIA